MIRLSFIVPFYNVEPYIEECIRSLYAQDIPQEEYEVICVDDCSPDGSRAIVERLQKEYPTLKLLIHTENKRQGGARNTGMKVAQGKYIWFVDSDDYIKPNCLKLLLQQAECEDLDILKFYYKQYPKHKFNQWKCTSSVVSGTELIFDIDTGEKAIVKCCTVWSQLIKKDLIVMNKIKFAENVQYEDDDYAYQLYAYAKRVRLISEEAYINRQTPNSTTRRKNDYRRANDMYAQALRMVNLYPNLQTIDARWGKLVKQSISNTLYTIFWILSDCKLIEQLHWFVRRKSIRCFRPFISRRMYMQLSSYLFWKLTYK